MMPNLNKRHAIMLGAVVLISSVAITGSAAATSPSDAIGNLADLFISEIANIGSALLGLYGLGQIIGLGFFSGDTSERMKKIGGSFGLVILLQSYGPINDWLTDSSNFNVTGMSGVDPTQFAVDGVATNLPQFIDVGATVVGTLPA